MILLGSTVIQLQVKQCSTREVIELDLKSVVLAYRPCLGVKFFVIPKLQIRSPVSILVKNFRIYSVSSSISCGFDRVSLAVSSKHP